MRALLLAFMTCGPAVEPSRTNQFVHSGDFDNAAWQGCSMTQENMLHTDRFSDPRGPLWACYESAPSQHPCPLRRQ